MCCVAIEQLRAGDSGCPTAGPALRFRHSFRARPCILLSRGLGNGESPSPGL